MTDEAGELIPQDPVEERRRRNQVAVGGNTVGNPRPVTVSTKLDRIAELARQIKGKPLTSLSHHIDVDFLKEAVTRTRRDGAVGVDQVTADDYEKDLLVNLQSLLDRLKKGTYFAPPVHLQAAYRTWRSACAGKLPVTELVATEVLDLPLFAGLRVEDVERVVEVVESCAVRPAVGVQG